MHNMREDRSVMTVVPSSPPQRVLLATDLGPRCDRALDRAVALADQWGAELIAVHALEENDVPAIAEAEQDLPSWRRGPRPLELAQAALNRALEGVSRPVTTVVEEGDASEVILAAAQRKACDVIVIAVARDEPLGRFFIGSTVDRVLRNARVPVLVVRQRPRHAYGSIVVGVDLSPASRVALGVAGTFFPGVGYRVLHAYEPPLGGMLTDPTDYRDAYGKVVTNDVFAFLKEAGATGPQLLDVLVERGTPAQLIQQYVSAFSADLVVLGTQGKGPLLELLVGSTAKSVLDGLSCDALVVPAAEG